MTPEELETLKRLADDGVIRHALGWGVLGSGMLTPLTDKSKTAGHIAWMAQTGYATHWFVSSVEGRVGDNITEVPTLRPDLTSDEARSLIAEVLR